MTEAFADVEMPVASKKRASLRCKVDTGAGGNVIPLRAFGKLFPNRLTKNGLPTGLRKCNTKLRAYNGTNIPQLGALDTTISWKDEETNNIHKMETTFYVADTPGPAILGLPSCSRLRIVHLNCSVQLRKHGKPVKSCPEREKVKQEMKSLQPISTREDLIKAYPDRFEGIGKFPGTYHIYLKEDAIPVVHAPRKCPIAVRPLVDTKLDKLLEQEVIVPVTEPTDWVSSLAYSWKADGDLRTCLNLTHLNKAIRRDHYRTPTLEEITHELAGSKKFTKVDGSSSYYCIVLDYESSLLTTFNTHRERFRFLRLPFGLACAQELQSFLGMVTYLSPFIPLLSSHTATLRGLLKTDVEYSWNATYQVAFDKLKSLVCEDTTLRYFNTKKPVTIQVDASGKGLGATLIQDDGPVAFASKALTPTEQRYANNERELLACVFGAERFRTYVFGRHFTIESDHKSLEQISMKNLADAPVRLQRMLLRLQDYDFTIKYRPGEEMVVADTLSRYSPEDTSEILLDISVNHVYINAEKKQDYQLTIQDDPLLRALADMIITGWPDDVNNVPKALRPYHGQRDSLTIEDGLILRGEAIIVPPGERRKVLEQIHQGHLGISKCQYRARHCVYWPGINKDIEHLVEACSTCQRHRPQEPRQPLKPTPPPERPWQHLGADFMSFDGSEYLVIVDYYPKMPIVRRMPTSQCTAAKTITHLKELFAEHGIPESIRSDNGPQFSSHLFKEFAEKWNFTHHTSSPTNPRSNGQAESAVKIIKGLLTRSKCAGEDPYLALLAYRSTPVDSHL